jgi:hypothetical protein
VASSAADDDDLAVLKAAYEDVVRENGRLRDARASVTRQLGPLPISAAVVGGLVAGFPGGDFRRPAQIVLLAVSAGLFLVMVVVSSAFASRKPYRLLRSVHEDGDPRSPRKILDAVTGDRAESPADPTADRRSAAQAAWYRAMIELEYDVREGWEKSQRCEPLTENAKRTFVEGLVQGFSVERRALIVVQVLFFAVVVLLLLARLV